MNLEETVGARITENHVGSSMTLRRVNNLELVL